MLELELELLLDELLLELDELELELDELLESGLSSAPPHAVNNRQTISTGKRVLITAHLSGLFIVIRNVWSLVVNRPGISLMLDKKPIHEGAIT